MTHSLGLSSLNRYFCLLHYLRLRAREKIGSVHGVTGLLCGVDDWHESSIGAPILNR